MKRSVGLILVTAIHDGQNGEIFMAVLQRRGRWNTEKTAPESYPGCCQVSIHGKLKEGEDFYEGLIRESCEELGKEFTEACQEDIPLTELLREKTDDKEIRTYGAFIPVERLSMVRLGPDSGGLDLVLGDNFFNGQVKEIAPDMKQDGPPYGVIALFPDEIQAIKKALETFTLKRHMSILNR